MLALLQVTMPVAHSWQEALIYQLPTILTSLGGFAGVLIGGLKLIKGQKNASIQRDAATEKVAVQVSQVAAKQQEQSAKVLIVAKETHSLVNGQHGVALSTILDQAIQIFSLTGTPAAQAKVEEARKNLAAHEAKQLSIQQSTMEVTQ